MSLFILILFFLLPFECQTCENYFRCEKPNLWGLWSYDALFTRPIMLKNDTFIQHIMALGRLHIVKLARVDDGTDFSNFIEKERWAKFRGQLTKFSPYSVENVEAIGNLSRGSFIGTIYAKNDPIYLEEVPKKFRNAPGLQGATAIVYKDSQQKPFEVITPGNVDHQFEGFSAENNGIYREDIQPEGVVDENWEFKCKILSVFDLDIYNALLKLHENKDKVKSEIDNILKTAEEDLNYVFRAGARNGLVQRITFDFNSKIIFSEKQPSRLHVDYTIPNIAIHAQLESFGKLNLTSKYCAGIQFTHRHNWTRLGLAYQGGACFGGGLKDQLYFTNAGIINTFWKNSFADVTDISYFVRHEISHLFNAPHDDSACSEGGPFLMDDGTLETGIARWRLSSCSWAAIRRHIQKLASIKNGLISEDKYKNCIVE